METAVHVEYDEVLPTEVASPERSSKHDIDAFDELFFPSKNDHNKSTEDAQSRTVDEVVDNCASGALSSPEGAVSVIFKISSSESPIKDISPIQWDRVSETDQIQDVVNVETTENEFSKESEEVPQFESFRSESSTREEVENHTESGDLTLETIRDYDQLFCNTKYFLIKSNNHENVDIAKSKSAWATPISNESRLNKAYFDSDNVLLIFSVKESGRFQGFARLASPSDPRLHVDWILPTRMAPNMLSSPFKLDWITKNELQFNNTAHLTNAWNEGKPVKIGRDGQEIEPTCGQSLCRLFSLDRIDQLSSIVKKIESKDPSMSQNHHDESYSRRHNAVNRLATSSRPHTSSRRSHDLGIRSGQGSVGLLGSIYSSASSSRSNIPSLMSQVNPAAAAVAAAMSAYTPQHHQNSILAPADITRLMAVNPNFATQLLAQPGNPLLASLHAGNMGVPGMNSQDRPTQYRRSRSRSPGRSNNRDGSGDRNRRGEGDNSYRRREDYYRSSRESYRDSRHSRDRSRGDRERDRRRSLSRSPPLLGADALANWNYEDYLQQVSRGLHTNINPLISNHEAVRPTQIQTDLDADRLYEERVNAFLRNDTHKSTHGGGRSNRHRSRSSSRSHSSDCPPSPPPRSRPHKHFGGGGDSDDYYDARGSRPRERCRR